MTHNYDDKLYPTCTYIVSMTDILYPICPSHLSISHLPIIVTWNCCRL